MPTSSRSSTTFTLTGLFLLTTASLIALSGCKKKPDEAGADAAVEAAVEAAAPDAGDTADAAPTLDAPDAATTVHHPTGVFAAGEAWSGTYQCGAKPSTGTLKITKVVGNAVSGIFEFKTFTNKSGSYLVSGPYTPDGHHLALSAGGWVVQPAGVVSVSFDGNVSADNHTYSGKAIGPNCSTFAFRR